jgi:hypothetical protein
MHVLTHASKIALIEESKEVWVGFVGSIEKLTDGQLRAERLRV